MIQEKMLITPWGNFNVIKTNDCADFAAIRNLKCFVLFARGVIEITTLKLGLKASRVNKGGQELVGAGCILNSTHLI